MHHMNPSSRGGETNEFNLYPYRVKRHRYWHDLFLNMTIWEVWNHIEEIHDAIFLADDEVITRHWLFVCELPSPKDLRQAMDKEYNVVRLQEAWVVAFGGWELPGARRFLKRMMLFMIFGSDMASTNRIFDNGNLDAFFERYPVENERAWAFRICFGQNAGWQALKSKMSKILRQSP
jgi:hypothetical protein